jgi:hypothetical protein
MADGVELAATLYLPEPADGPQPCILEALPYRKDDLTSGSRPEYQRLVSEHSYAVCRLDLRGTGSSGGEASDEYPAIEQRDLAAVISWLAGQDWCTGAVGMYGTSYSGFNSLQMACERPPELKAVVAIFATDDRYTDDVHYRGGALKLLDLVDYCHYMTPMNALPPVPARWGEHWREEWRARIDAHEPWLFTWLEQQCDSAYWRHGSVRPDYARIACPVLLVAGWADGYRNNSFRTLEALREAGVPHRLLAGPWAHASTETTAPGPRIDLVPEMAAWWDRWLRGIDNGVDDGSPQRPAVTCFVRSSTRPAPDLDSSAGEWIREEWPSPRVTVRELALSERPPYAVRPDTGVDAWIDCAGHLPYGQSMDQRFDDAASLTWEWDAEELRLLGYPVARLRLSADQPVAGVSVKLCDVFPDGTSALVARGSLNLSHRDGSDAPTPVEPGTPYDVEVLLDACAYAFAPGQRLRLSVAGADWPNTAAPPAPLTLTVHGGGLELPVHIGASPYPPPVLVPGASTSAESAEGVTWRVERDVLRRETACVVEHRSTYPIPFDGTASEAYSGRVSVDTHTFEQRAQADVSFRLEWPDGCVSTNSALDVRLGPDSYDVDIWLDVRDGDEQVAERTWHRSFPRQLQ